MVVCSRTWSGFAAGCTPLQVSTKTARSAGKKGQARGQEKGIKSPFSPISLFSGSVLSYPDVLCIWSFFYLKNVYLFYLMHEGPSSRALRGGGGYEGDTEYVQVVEWRTQVCIKHPTWTLGHPDTEDDGGLMGTGLLKHFANGKRVWPSPLAPPRRGRVGILASCRRSAIQPRLGRTDTIPTAPNHVRSQTACLDHSQRDTSERTCYQAGLSCEESSSVDAMPVS